VKMDITALRMKEFFDEPRVKSTEYGA